jgi:hypothetical protein
MMSYDAAGNVVTGVPDFSGGNPIPTAKTGLFVRWCPKKGIQIFTAVCEAGTCGAKKCEHYKQATA